MTGNEGAAGLLAGELKVVNLGLERFARDLTEQGVEVSQVEWSPPAGGHAELAHLIANL